MDGSHTSRVVLEHVFRAFNVLLLCFSCTRRYQFHLRTLFLSLPELSFLSILLCTAILRCISRVCAAGYSAKYTGEFSRVCTLPNHAGGVNTSLTPVADTPVSSLRTRYRYQTLREVRYVYRNIPRVQVCPRPQYRVHQHSFGTASPPVPDTSEKFGTLSIPVPDTWYVRLFTIS